MNQVRVRMYRPGGLGDCFLLSFPKSEEMSHMLIDCGVLKGTEEGKARMKAIVADIVQTTGGRLDVLVVTHEHWDHVSGFVQAEDEFKQLSIGEVWLAWTEKSDDDLAKELRQHKTKARKAVDAALQKLKLSAAPAAQTAIQALNSLSQFSGDFGVAGGRTTAEAMTWARERTGAKPLLPPGAEPLAIPGLDGVRAFVLGPPKNATLLKQSDPSKRTPEVYQLVGGMDLGFMAAMLDAEGMDSGRPFDVSFETQKDKAKDDSEFREFYENHYYSKDDWRQIELDWLGTAEGLALQLDSDTNNTSLVLAIELIDSGRVLLFPGDAQVGNWLSWEPLTWTVKNRNGESTKVTARDLLARTVLYKVGHHASHNATLRENGLELMQSDKLVAMIPVYEEQAHAQGKKDPATGKPKGWEMPFGPLLTRLQEKTSGRVFRADTGLPAPWPKGYSESDEYIDYAIEM